MFNLILKLMVKDSQNTTDPTVRSNYGKVSGVIGISSNIVLFALKFLLGTFFNSVSIIADSINNLTDGISSGITLVGFKMASKPADKEHPYGHARIEYIAGILVSFLVITIGWELVVSSFHKILNPTETNFTIVVFAGLAISIAIKLWQGSFYKFVGKKIKSTTIMANATDSINDVISTSVVLVGAVITTLFNINLDGYFGMLVAVFIIYSGIMMVIETSKPLLGESPNSDMVRSIREKVLSYEGVLGVHDLMIHSYGAGKIFASLHCEVKSSANIMESHDLMDNIEQDFLKNMGIEMVIHMDPIDTDDEKTNGLREKICYLVLDKYPQSSIHDFRVVWGIDHSNIVFDICVDFTEKDNDKKIVKNLTEIIKEIDKNYNLSVTVDRV